jgi:hypothetical protein
MTKGPAQVWAENFLAEHIENEGTYVFPDYGQFIEELMKHFQDIAAKTDSLFEIGKIKQAEQPIEEFNAEFHRHLGRARIQNAGDDTGLIMNQYLSALNEGLAHRVLQ